MDLAGLIFPRQAHGQQGNATTAQQGHGTTGTAAAAATAKWKKYGKLHNLAWEKDIQYFFAAVVTIFLIGYAVEEIRLIAKRRSTKASSSIYQYPRNVLKRMSLLSMKIPVIGARVYAPMVMMWMIFAGFLVAAILSQTPNSTFKQQFDLKVVAKRSGHVGTACLPILFFLSMKNSVIGLLIGSSHERLNIVHRWAGRTIISIFAVHLITYTIFYARTGALENLTEFGNVCGIIGFVLLLLIGVTSIAIARRRAYEVFYIIHWAFTVAVLALSWLHVHDTIPFVKASIGIISGDLVLRLLRVWSSSPGMKFYSQAKIESINDKLLSVTIPLPKIGTMRSWTPGSHAFLNVPTLGLHQKHPFTIASIPADDHIQFVIKKQRGFTATLHKNAATELKCLVDGPYGSLEMTRFSKYPHVLLIGGGVGITFVLPILKSLLAGDNVVSTITFIWSTNDVSTMEYFRQVLEGVYRRHETSDSKVVLTIKLHLTGGSTTEGISVVSAPPSPSIGLSMEKKELSETAKQLDDSSFSIHRQRASLTDVVQEVSQEHERLAIGVCGPNALVLESRRVVAAEMGSKDIWLYTEGFEW